MNTVERASENPIALMVNWGRLLVNGDVPLSGVHQILESDVPLSGVILSGAGPSADGFMDSHNSHLDPQSGFTEADAMSCACCASVKFSTHIPRHEM